MCQEQMATFMTEMLQNREVKSCKVTENTADTQEIEAMLMLHCATIQYTAHNC